MVQRQKRVHIAERKVSETVEVIFAQRPKGVLIDSYIWVAVSKPIGKLVVRIQGLCIGSEWKIRRSKEDVKIIIQQKHLSIDSLVADHPLSLERVTDNGQCVGEQVIQFFVTNCEFDLDRDFKILLSKKGSRIYAFD